MRDIIFRGKRIDNGEWVEGSLLKVTIDGKTAHLIFGDNFCFVGNDVKAMSHALVDPDTVGQYTELKDKNGKRIFEGDIWTYLRHNGVIRWSQEDCAFVAEYIIGGIEYESAVTEGKAKKFEIIGNIHDNPEMIGGNDG